MAPLPLGGLRVIDLTHYTAGPFCTRMLGDYGAEVIKIERPPAGDPARALGPFYRDEPGPEGSAVFLFLNTNKRSVILDLKSGQGKQVLKELVRGADVLVENFNPRVMPSLGLDYKALRKVNPRLVMTSISNFGQTGPYRDWEGTDLTLWAMGGNMIVTGDPAAEPVKPAGHLASYAVGYMAALATLVATFAAEARGEGEHLDVSFFEVAAHWIDGTFPRLMRYQYTKEMTPRRQTGAALGVGSGIYPCADGFFFSVGGAIRFPNTARMVGADHLLEQPEWATIAARSALERSDEFDALFVPWMLERTRKEVRALHQEYGVLGAPINSVAEALQDEHLRGRGYFQAIDHPATGPQTYPGYNFILHRGEPMPPRWRAPLLGEHTQEVLCDELGYSEARLQSLRKQGII